MQTSREAALLAQRRIWLAAIGVLACTALLSGWLLAGSLPARATLIVGVLGLAGVAALAVVVGSRLGQELGRKKDHAFALAAIVETTGDAVLTARLDRTITAWNKGAERLFGYTAEEMLGSSVARLTASGTDQSLQAPLNHVLENGAMYSYDAQRRHKSGELIDVAITLSPLRNAAGEIVAISSIARNVSDRKRLEAQRGRLLEHERQARADAERAYGLVEEQNGRLREIDRLKDELVASVSHELRTPLTSISGYLELVLEDADRLSEEQQRFLGIVGRNADRLLQLIGDLLFVAQLKSSTLELDRAPVELSQVVAIAVESLLPTARDGGLKLTLECAALPRVCGDRARLAQVIDNLLTNALKFTPPGGHVNVRGFERDGSVCLQVCDDGMGISTDDQAQLFERFFRTSSAQAGAIRGTGLGLSIAAGIVEAHEGSIDVESETGVGSTFTVTLPAWLSPDPLTAAPRRGELISS